MARGLRGLMSSMVSDELGRQAMIAAKDYVTTLVLSKRCRPCFSPRHEKYIEPREAHACDASTRSTTTGPQSSTWQQSLYSDKI